jgi:hypothetical protein
MFKNLRKKFIFAVFESTKEFHLKDAAFISQIGGTFATEWRPAVVTRMEGFF